MGENTKNSEYKKEDKVKRDVESPKETTIFRPNVSYLNLRSAPSKAARVLLIIGQFSNVIVDKKVNNDWTKVTVEQDEETHEGFVMGTYLEVK